MASQNYLIAIALIEQNLLRAMPLGGKEVKDNLEDQENFKKLGEEVVLNLLLRVFQRSDEGALKRSLKIKAYFWFICILKGCRKSFHLLNLNG